MHRGPGFWRKQMETRQWENLGLKRKKKKTHIKETRETATSFVNLLCYLKNAFFTIITFRGRL